MLRVSTLRFGWSFSLPITFYLNLFGRGVSEIKTAPEIPDWLGREPAGCDLMWSHIIFYSGRDEGKRPSLIG